MKAHRKEHRRRRAPASPRVQGSPDFHRRRRPNGGHPVDPPSRANLLAALAGEAEKGPLTRVRLAELARKHGAPLSAVQSLYSFYFPPDHGAEVKVCRGLPCALRANGRAEAQEWGASCLGYCADAPVMWKKGRYFSLASGRPREIRESTRAWVTAHAQRLRAYREAGGYAALERVLADPDPASLLSAVEAAVLRGMGGAGFPVALKWKAVMGSPRPDRVVVVNAHEGEPGTFKDRLILEREPHRLLEGALLAASVVGATEVVIALKSEYVNALSVLERSLRELDEASVDLGFHGNLPSVEIRPLVGSYVTGEETALLEALEGRRSEPRPRPPFPAEVGLQGRPTLVQNVETLASIPALLHESPDPTATGKVAKVFCLTGDVETPGAYREPLGIRAASLIETRGASPSEAFKAFLPGGLSGGILPASRLDIELDFDAVKRNGGGLGTGAIIAIGKDRCIVDVLSNVGEFFRTESCGKCVPCRLGTAKLSDLFGRLREGKATESDLREAETLAKVMQETSLCALGQVAGKPFLDAMRDLREEILAHVRGECPARICRAGGG